MFHLIFNHSKTWNLWSNPTEWLQFCQKPLYYNETQFSTVVKSINIEARCLMLHIYNLTRIAGTWLSVILIWKLLLYRFTLSSQCLLNLLFSCCMPCLLIPVKVSINLSLSSMPSPTSHLNPIIITASLLYTILSPRSTLVYLHSFSTTAYLIY